MKFYKIKTLFLLSFVSATLFSCVEDDRLENARNQKPVVTLDRISASVTEGEEITFKLTVDKALSQDMDFKLELIGGTGSYRDYVTSGVETTIDEGGYGQGIIGNKLVFPAFQTSMEFTITPIFDIEVEGTETLEIRLRSSGNGLGLVADGSDMINITIANKVSNDFFVSFDFSQNYYDTFGSLVEPGYIDNTANAGEHAYCDVDFDLEIYDVSESSVLADSYSSCPESITLDAASPDGTYVIVPSLWTTTGNAVPKTDFFFKTKVTMAKPGVWVKEVRIDNTWKFSAGGAQQGNPLAYKPIAKLVKTGTSYVLQDYATGDVLASGKMANFKLNSKKLNKK